MTISPTNSPTNNPNNLYLCTTCFELSSHGETSQQCDCEPQKKYDGIDCPSGIHLCYICQSRLAGGTSRWSWEACGPCLDANKALEKEGFTPLPLGRHSVMNGIAIAVQAPKDQFTLQSNQLLTFINSLQEIRAWSIEETKKKYLSVEKWATLNQIPAKLWIKEFTHSKSKENTRPESNSDRALSLPSYLRTSPLQSSTDRLRQIRVDRVIPGIEPRREH